MPSITSRRRRAIAPAATAAAALALITLATPTTADAQILTNVGTIHAGQALTRIVADPVRDEVYGLASNGDVLFMNASTLAVQKTIHTGRAVTDIDVAPDGSFMTVLDNVNRQYWGQPPAVYVLSYDLASQTQSAISMVQSPLFHMALGRSNRIAGVGVNQWVDVYQDNLATGTQLSAAGGGYFGSGDTDWSTVTLLSNPAGTRMYRTDIGISSIDVIAFDISTDTIHQVGARTVGSYATVPLAINSSGSSLYVGGTRLDPNNLQTVLGVFPETIYAATGDDAYAFGASGIYDPTWGNRLGSMPVNSTHMTMGYHDRYLFALDSTGGNITVLQVIPEPTTAATALAVTSLLPLTRRRRHR